MTHIKNTLAIITIAMIALFGATTLIFAQDADVEADADTSVTIDGEVDTDEEDNEEEAETSDDADDAETTDDSSDTDQDDDSDTPPDEDDADADAEVDADAEARVNDGTTGAIRARIQQQMKLQEERRAQLQRQKEAREAEIQEKKERMRSIRINARVALAKRIAVRLGNIHERLSDIADRIGSRIDSAEDTADTTDTERQLAEARIHLDTAASDIAEVEAFIETWVDIHLDAEPNEIAEMVRENQSSFRELVVSAKESLRAAHSTMRGVIGELNTSVRADASADLSAQAGVGADADVENDDENE